jgi:hypothetical protein
MSGDLITFGVGPQGSVTRLLTFGLEIGEESDQVWTPVTAEGGSWTPVTPESTVWT